jgi:hypothetical protein
VSFDEPSLEDVFIAMTGSKISGKDAADGTRILA